MFFFFLYIATQLSNNYFVHLCYLALSQFVFELNKEEEDD